MFIEDLRKSAWLLFVGLLTAVLIYPFLHEMGHVLAVVLLGGRVTEFHLLPLPNVLCDGGALRGNDFAAVGFGGMLFPFLLSVVVRIKQFTVWYAAQVIKGISMLAFGISLVSLFGMRYGICITDDDMVVAMRFCQSKEEFTCAVGFMFAWTGVSVFKQRPIKQIYRYFGINEK